MVFAKFVTQYTNPLLISTWFLKNQVQQTGFLVYFELDFTASVACRLKIQFADLEFLNLIFQKWSADQQGENKVSWECKSLHKNLWKA